MTESDFSKHENEKRKEAFLSDLKALLTKHNATLELEETSRGWNGSTYTISASLDGYAVHDVEYVHGVEVDLGTYFTKEG